MALNDFQNNSTYQQVVCGCEPVEGLPEMLK